MLPGILFRMKYAVVCVLADDWLAAGQELEFRNPDFPLRQGILSGSPGIDRLHHLLVVETGQTRRDLGDRLEDGKKRFVLDCSEMALPDFPDRGVQGLATIRQRDDAELLGEIGVTCRSDQQPAGLLATFAILGGRSEPLLRSVASP